MPLFICFAYSQIYIFNIEEKEMNDLIMDKPIETEKSINFYNRDINIPLKFKLHQKVYYPRITDRGKLLDIREYYIVKLPLSLRDILHLLIIMCHHIRKNPEDNYFVMEINYLALMMKH